MIGPAQKDIHQIGERVYLPDVTESLPLLFCELIQLAGQPGM
jgi:arginine utilization protein RocB